MQSLQIKERDARLSFDGGDKLGALNAVWEILKESPRSPVASLGFKICRETHDPIEADRLRKFLEEQQAFNDQSKLDWVMVQLSLGFGEAAQSEIRELTASDKSIAFRLHVAKSLAARGYEVARHASDSQLKPNPPEIDLELLRDRLRTIRDSTSTSKSGSETALVAPEGRLNLGGLNLESNNVQMLAESARAHGVARNLEGLRQLYSQYRDASVIGQRGYFMTVVLKSTSVIANAKVEEEASPDELLKCVSFAELVFGDILESRYRLNGHQFAPMIETHLSAQLPRSAHKYLRWAMRSEDLSFQFHLWPFMRYLKRKGDVDGLLAFSLDCEEMGLVPDAHAVALICRELNRANRASESWAVLQKTQSATSARDSHVLMVALETLAALDRGHEMLSYLQRSTNNFVPDARAFGLIVDYFFSRKRFREALEILNVAERAGSVDAYLEYRLALTQVQLGDWNPLSDLIPRVGSLNVSPYDLFEVLEVLRTNQKHELYEGLCEQVKIITRRGDQALAADFGRTMEAQLIKQLFGNDTRMSSSTLQLLRELSPNSPIIRIGEQVTQSRESESTSSESSKPLDELLKHSTELSDEQLERLFVAASAALKILPALSLFKELIRRGLGNSWHLGTLLSDFVRHLPPEDLERIYDSYKASITGLEERSHRILFNLLAKAYRHAGRRVDVERLIAQMRSLGIQEDDFTLREQLEISSVKPSNVGLALTASGSLDFEALCRVLDDLRHEMSHFIAQLSLRLQAIGDSVGESSHPGVVVGVREALELTRKFSQRIEGYSDIADPNISGLCEVSDTLAKVLKECEMTAQSRGVSLVSNIAPQKYWVAINEYGLKTVVQNLIDNALTELKTNAPQHPRIRVSVLAPKQHRVGDLVSISIRDNGGGITEDMEEQIFTRGFTTRSGHGFGLGLALVRSVVESADGTIQLVRDGQPGAHFLIQFRLCEGPSD